MAHDPADAAAPIPAATDAETVHAWLGSLIPGVLLCAVIATAALLLRHFSGFTALSPMIVSIALGALLHNALGTPLAAKPGVAFSLRWILRFAIVLLGFQLTTQQVLDVGATGFAVIAISLIACFVVTRPLGAALGVDAKLTELIAAGTSICGASAVIAANTVTKAPEEDCAYAVACVTLCGMVAMVVYPLLPLLLGLSARDYGLWTGASVHEVAQVVAASYQAGKEAGDYATITKLTRVIMLAPMMMVLGAMATRRANGGGELRRAPLPYFALGFIAAIAANSTIDIAPDAKDTIIDATTFLLALSLAAMGLATDFKKLAPKGARPLVLGALSTVFIAVLSLLLVKLVA
jgi:uncharacterized integral membrane protein (TIGR00698 family)